MAISGSWDGWTTCSTWPATGSTYRWKSKAALVHHDKVAEAAVVGKPDEIKGEGISCFVTLRGGVPATEELKKELREHVAKEIGSSGLPG